MTDTDVERGAAPAGASQGATQAVVDAVRAVRLEDAPPEAVEVAKHCLLDWLGVTLAGASEQLAVILRDQLVRDGSGPSTIVGTRSSADLSTAALVNGATSHALDYDDTHTTMSGHPTVPVMPAVLALAERDGRSGAELLAALVAGVEAECLVGALVGPAHYARGWHATGTIGTFGSAAAAATLLGLDREAWLHAFGLAGTQAAGLKDVFGTMAKPLHAGKAAANGLLAATLAGAGFTSSTDILESPTGFAATYAEPVRAVEPDGPTWAIRRTLFKYHASCYLTHGVIESAKRLRAEGGLTGADVEAVELRVSPGVLDVCNIQEPRTGLEGKFSLRACSAMSLLGADTADLASFSDAAMESRELRDLIQRVVVTPDRDEAVTAGLVRVVSRDGSARDARTDMSVPADDLALQWSRLSDKFLSLTTPVLGAERAEALRQLVAGVEELPSVRDLAEATRP